MSPVRVLLFLFLCMKATAATCIVFRSSIVGWSWARVWLCIHPPLLTSFRGEKDVRGPCRWIYVVYNKIYYTHNTLMYTSSSRTHREPKCEPHLVFELPTVTSFFFILFTDFHTCIRIFIFFHLRTNGISAAAAQTKPMLFLRDSLTTCETSHDYILTTVTVRVCTKRSLWCRMSLRRQYVFSVYCFICFRRRLLFVVYI